MALLHVRMNCFIWGRREHSATSGRFPHLQCEINYICRLPVGDDGARVPPCPLCHLPGSVITGECLREHRRELPMTVTAIAAGLIAFTFADPCTQPRRDRGSVVLCRERQGRADRWDTPATCEPKTERGSGPRRRGAATAPGQGRGAGLQSRVGISEPECCVRPFASTAPVVACAFRLGKPQEQATQRFSRKQ